MGSPSLAALLRLYMDEDSGRGTLSEALKRAGFDVLTTGEAGNNGLDDYPQLAYSIEQGRTLVTANKRDFPRIHREWLLAGRSHMGIIVRTRQSLTIGEQLRAIQAISESIGEAAMVDRLEYMSQWLPRE